jgi:hypothetical protein
MSRRERAARPFLPKPSIELYQRSGKAVGPNTVPVAPSFLDLEQEQTVAYDEAVPLSALLAEARRSVAANEELPETPPPVLATTTSEIRPRRDSFRASHPPAEAPRLELVPNRSSAVHGESLPPALVQPRERRRRTSFGKVLLLAGIALCVAWIAAIELSSLANLPWLDPRPAIAKSFQAAKSKVPWDRLAHFAQRN